MTSPNVKASAQSCVTTTDGTLQLHQQGSQFSSQATACRRIQSRQGFIEQQELRPSGDRTRKRHTLLLPTRQLRRLGLLEPLKLQQVDQFADTLLLASAGSSLNPYSMLPATVCVGKSA